MIRKATKEDIAKINEIGSQSNADFAKLFHLETEVTKDFAIVLVSMEDAIIKGFIYALDFGDNIDLLYIAVDSTYQNQKIATKMLKFFVDNYQVNNKTITLEVAVNNYKALKLYEKFNFYEVNRRKEYYGKIDALLMRRN